MNEWIKVSDRLPPLEDINTFQFRSFPVLIFNKDTDRIETGYYIQYGDESIEWYIQGRDSYHAFSTHWMPLPSFPV